MKFLRGYQSARSVEFRLRMADVIVEEVGPALLAFVEKRCLREDVEDVSQDTLAAVVEKLDEFEIKGDSVRLFWGWCYQIARHKIADAHRRRSKESEHMSLDDEELAAEVLWQAIEASAVDEPISPGERLDLKDAIGMLKKLSPECHDCLWKHHVLGLPYSEIWETEKLDYDTARMRIKRCERKARDFLEPKG